MTLTKQLGWVALIAAIFLTALLLIENNRTPIANGSVSRFSEYQGTTTVTASFAPEQLVQTGAGTLGSVVITGAAAGTINIYDATTSNVALRTGNAPTSTILKASIPASAAAGTYTFDELLTNGLYVSIVGAVPTSTITYRAN